MKCPYCGEEIPVEALNEWFASRGGSKSKRKITPEQQRKMQAALKAKRKGQKR